MAKTQQYYNSLPECSIIDYEVIPLPEAALLWCGVKFEDLAGETELLTNISQSIYRHPYIPCLEKKTRILNRVVNNGELRAVREHGDGGEKYIDPTTKEEKIDHVAYSRRHFWISDLKKFISENYPNDRPKTIFHNEELKPVIDSAEYERMNKEYQKYLAENTNLQAKLNEIKTELANKESRIRDQDLAMQSLSIQLQQAKLSQQDAEERLERGRNLYAELSNKYKALAADPNSKLNLDNALYLLGEVLQTVKSKAKKWTQGEIIRDILEQRQTENRTAQGLEQRTIEEYFSNANKRLTP
ncbi:hypothetical protein BKK54_04820 [Rodentibacter genomosp. 1]|uniref:Uncharacterized protein n=2 Tax=Rodentibacter TaxID=1960084 RepID=A0A1V3JHE3_9PAST|nr:MULTISPECIES: hypothetical protein [Rodentibacter]OOF51017.1 hypothetical protein BKK54_04820 [Rodentibacter genomosp. 1]OOF56023.1 hypothetical protein BKL49_10795 [Rodentibacter myodis]